MGVKNKIKISITDILLMILIVVTFVGFIVVPLSLNKTNGEVKDLNKELEIREVYMYIAMYREGLVPHFGELPIEDVMHLLEVKYYDYLPEHVRDRYYNPDGRLKVRDYE